MPKAHRRRFKAPFNKTVSYGQELKRLLIAIRRPIIQGGDLSISVLSLLFLLLLALQRRKHLRVLFCRPLLALLLLEFRGHAVAIGHRCNGPCSRSYTGREEVCLLSDLFLLFSSLALLSLLFSLHWDCKYGSASILKVSSKSN